MPRPVETQEQGLNAATCCHWSSIQDGQLVACLLLLPIYLEKEKAEHGE